MAEAKTKKAATKAAATKKATEGEVMHNMFSGKYFYAAGKRKTAIARVRVYEKGKGEIIVNGKDYTEYFTGTLLGRIKSPLKLTNVEGFSITAKIVGGGLASQADALRHGIAKALTELDAAHRGILKKEGQLTRDARKVERKKPGRRKARRGQQWVKR